MNTKETVMKPMIVILMLTLLLGGCKDSTPDPPERTGDAEGEMTITHTLNIDGISVTVEGAPLRSETSPEGHRLFQIGDHKFHLKDGEFYLDDKSYGKATQGDEVEITTDGSVLVNDEIRSQH
jgi:hypothetical protein